MLVRTLAVAEGQSQVSKPSARSATLVASRSYVRVLEFASCFQKRARLGKVHELPWGQECDHVPRPLVANP